MVSSGARSLWATTTPESSQVRAEPNASHPGDSGHHRIPIRVRCRSPEPVLREQRILTGFEGGPFVDYSKILRTQVLHRVREKGWNVIGVTQPWRAGGKTFTAVNLAASLAMDVTQSVLLVDANLRHPSVHQMFDLGECQDWLTICWMMSRSNNCWCIPALAGSSCCPADEPSRHSAEALTSPKMVALVDEF